MFFHLVIWTGNIQAPVSVYVKCTHYLISKQNLIPKALSTVSATHKWPKLIAIIITINFSKCILNTVELMSKEQGMNRRRAQEGVRGRQGFKSISHFLVYSTQPSLIMSNNLTQRIQATPTWSHRPASSDIRL